MPGLSVTRTAAPRRLSWHVLRQRRGNVMMMFALALPALTCSIGMGVDYARAMKSQTKLNAIADAAALLAVSKTAMRADDPTAAYFARTFFTLQSAALVKLDGVTLSNVTVQAPTDANGRRTATVSYTASSSNVFARIMGLDALTISGKSATTNAIAPDIDFYMLLDVSSSMALPTTTVGLAKVAASNSDNCQFACHSVNDVKGRDANGKITDLYGVAKSYNLTLRIDDEGTAVSKLTTNAKNTASKNGANYRIAIASFRGKGAFSILQPKTADMAAAAKTTQNLVPYQFYKNKCPTQACRSNEPGYGDNDTATSDAMDQISSQLITDPGTGISKNAPQGVMFIITDGMRDEARDSNDQLEVAIDTAKCDTIKARGVRIAVLYTEYLPESFANNAFGQAKVAPYLYKVEPALKACASSGLYTKVTTDQDIYSALDALFQNAVATARITR